MTAFALYLVLAAANLHASRSMFFKKAPRVVGRSSPPATSWRVSVTVAIRDLPGSQNSLQRAALQVSEAGHVPA